MCQIFKLNYSNESKAIILKWRRPETVVNLPRSGQPTQIPQQIIQEVAKAARQTLKEKKKKNVLLQNSCLTIPALERDPVQKLLFSGGLQCSSCSLVWLN